MNFEQNQDDDFLTLKMHGNTYMQDKQYLKAIKNYNLALKKLEEEDDKNLKLKNSLLVSANKSEAFIKLGYFYSGLKECNDILNTKNVKEFIEENLYEKTLFRKARILEQLTKNENDLEESKKFYNQMKQVPANALENLESKRQNLNGKYNKKILMNYEKECLDTINSKKYYLDSLSKEYKFSSYFNEKLISEEFSTEKGIHYIAKDDIKEGTLLIAELPIISVYEAEIKKFSSAFDKFKSMGFTKNEIAIEILYTYLKDKLNFEEEKAIIKDQLSELSTLQNAKMNREERRKKFELNDDIIKEVLSNNAIITVRNNKDKIEPDDLCYGLFYKTSFFNHCCDSNCFHFGIANMIFVKTIKNIKKGEELTVSYLEPKHLPQRKNEMEKWEFQCKCKFCMQEIEICDKVGYFDLYEIFVKIQNMMTLSKIETYQNLEENLTVDKQDTIKVIIYNLMKKNVINYEDDRFKFTNFIFFKTVALIVGHFPKMKKLANFLFEKAFDAIKNISRRERFDLIKNWLILCKDEIFELRKEELENIIKNDEKIFYDL